MLGRQAGADFKECLSISRGQLIEDRSSGRVRQGLEDIAQPGPIIGKSLLACQGVRGVREAGLWRWRLARALSIARWLGTPSNPWCVKRDVIAHLTIEALSSQM